MKLFYKSFLFCLLSSVIYIPIFAQNSSQIERGKLHLKNWDFDQDGSLNINGEWELYVGQFITADASFEQFQKERTWTNELGLWTYQKKNQINTKERIATYRAKIYGKNLPEEMGIYVREIKSSYKLFINTVKVGQNGKVADNVTDYRANIMGQHFTFTPNSDTLTVVIHIADFMFLEGGIQQPIMIGTARNVKMKYQSVVAWDAFLMGAFLVMGLYHLFLLMVVRKDQIDLWFALICFVMVIRMFVVNNHYLDVSQHEYLPLAMSKISHIIPICIFKCDINLYSTAQSNPTGLVAELLDLGFV